MTDALRRAVRAAINEVFDGGDDSLAMSDPDGQVAKDAIAEYTGREWFRVAFVADPQVRGTWAARATDASGKRAIDFLIHDWDGRAAIDPWSQLEDTAFKVWPPRAGKIRLI